MKKMTVVIMTLALMSCRQGDDKPSQTPAQNQTPPVENTSTPTAIPKEWRDKQENLCLQDLCGPATHYLASRGEGPFAKLLSEDIKIFLKDEVTPRLEKTTKMTLKNLRDQAQLLTKTLERMEQADFTDEQFAWIVYQSISAKLIPHMKNILEDRNGRSYLVFEKIPHDIVSTQPHFYHAAVSFINVIYTSRAYSLSGAIGENLMKHKFAVTKNDKDTKSAWMRYLNQLKHDRQNFENRFGIHTFAEFNSEVVAKEMAGHELTRREMTQLLNFITRVAILKAFDEPTVQNAARHLNLDIYGWLDAINWWQTKRKIEAFLQNSATEETLLHQLRSSCDEAAIQSLAAAPSDFKLKRAQLLLDGVKAAAKSATGEYLQGTALTKAQAAIDKVRFENPKTQDQAQRMTIADLEGLVENQERKAKTLSTATTLEDRVSLVSNQISFLLVDPELTLSLGAKKACDSLKPPIFEDHARSEGDNLIIRLGWQSANFHELGAGIMAHEIGHIVSSAANILESADQEYWKTRQCSTDIHQGLLAGRNLTHKAQQYQEEDWADAFAVTTLKILNRTWPHVKNYACALTSIQEGKYSGNGLITASATDAHSTGLYRALQIHLGLGSTLPESCNSYLEDRAQVISRTCSK